MSYEQDRLELDPRAALALQYSADVQYRMWRTGFDWRVTDYTHNVWPFREGELNNNTNRTH